MNRKDFLKTSVAGNVATMFGVSAFVPCQARHKLHYLAFAKAR
ncbi:hypothetical protein ACFO5T_05670 [Dokdonia genika]|uniref:Twin-arginine translocation signal domain-containing protein n=1 Tax=Dokdonia genika TaxID=308113 RepID=A0ABV9L8C3_9FLAO